MKSLVCSVAICTATILIATTVEPVMAGKLKFINFDVAGALRGTYPTALNDNNIVVGYSEDNSFRISGFLRSQDGSLVSFDAPAAMQTYPISINANDEVAGYFVDGSYVTHGFIREPDGTVTVVDFPESTSTYLYGMNNGGEIVGETENPGYHGFLKKRDGKFKAFDVPNAATAATVINDAGIIAGRYCTMSCWTSTFSGFVRTSNGTISTFTVVGGEKWTLPLGLNRPGTTVGVGVDVNGTREGFIRQPEGQITIDSNCGFSGINNKGWIVGSSTLDTYYHGCLRGPDGGETFFDDPKAGTEELQGTSPAGINNNLYVIGYYQDSGFDIHGFLVRLRN